MAVVEFRGAPFKHSLSEAELKEANSRIQDARVKTRELFKLLQASIKEGNTADEDHARALLTMSPDALLCAALQANKKLKPRARRTLERCLAVPGLIDLSKPLAEPVPFYPLGKKSGGFRMICNPGFRHRTCEHAVLKVMGAYLKPRKFQFTHLGVQKAIAEAKKRLGTEYLYVARLDIKDFFPSFDPDKLGQELPLPKEVAEHVVVGRHMKVDVDQEKLHGSTIHSLPHSDILLSLARLGIPQGSVCSPIIGTFCMSRLAWKPMSGVVLINYADDFLILAKSPELLEKAVGQLIDDVGKLPSGHFELKLILETAATSGFDFLGHRLRAVDGKTETSPTKANEEALWARLACLDDQLSKLAYPPGTIKPWKDNSKGACPVLAEMLALINGWHAAFSQCDNLEGSTSFAMAQIDQWASALGLTMLQVKAAMDPSMGYEPTDSAFGH